MNNQVFLHSPVARCGHWIRAFFLTVTVLLAACGSRVELLSNLQENEANEVVGALLNVGIDVSKKPGKEGTVTLELEQHAVAKAISTLDKLGLPHHRRSKMGDVFKKENLISSSLEERARYLYSLSQELEQTLTQIDGVVTARVHVVLPERLGPGDPNLPSSASVFIKHQEGFGVENTVNEIRAIVANSVSGLTKEKVAVVLFSTKNHDRDNVVPWTDVLFFKVVASSAPALWTVLGVLTLISLLGLAAITYLMLQTGFFADLVAQAKVSPMAKQWLSPRAEKP